MKLVYVISKYTNVNSNYKLHIPNPYDSNMPICGSKKAFTIEFTEGERPTCKKCLKIFNEFSQINRKGVGDDNSKMSQVPQRNRYQ